MTEAEALDLAATSEIYLTPTGHANNCDWHVDQYPWECTCGFIPRKKAMDDLIAQDADLIAKFKAGEHRK